MYLNVNVKKKNNKNNSERLLNVYRNFKSQQCLRKSVMHHVFVESDQSNAVELS